MAAHEISNEWNAEMESDLIQEIEIRPNLWDVKDPFYSKKTLKGVKYEEITIVMKEKWPTHAVLFDPDLLLKKFSNLKSYDRRQRNTLLALKSGAAGVGFKPKWGHFDRMSVLNDTFCAARSTSNLNMKKKKCTELSQSASESVSQWELEEEDNFLNEEDLSQMPLEVVDEILPHTPQQILSQTPPEILPHASQNLLQTPTLVPPQGKKRKKPMSSSEVTNYLKSLNDENKIDSGGTFGQFVAAELRRIPDSIKKEKAKLEIHKILFNIKTEL